MCNCVFLLSGNNCLVFRELDLLLRSRKALYLFRTDVVIESLTRERCDEVLYLHPMVKLFVVVLWPKLLLHDRDCCCLCFCIGIVCGCWECGK